MTQHGVRAVAAMSTPVLAAHRHDPSTVIGHGACVLVHAAGHAIPVNRIRFLERFGRANDLARTDRLRAL